MNLVSLRLITADPQRLAAFYELATGLSASWLTPDFAEIATPTATLAIAHERTMPVLSAEAAQASTRATIDFLVDNVDQTFEQLRGAAEVAQEPTTMPWGNRSLLLRDPDGNLVNLFTPVTAAAVLRFSRPAEQVRS